MRQIRWSELLKQYKFIIYYTPGKDNGRADALSKKLNYIIIKKESFALFIKGKNKILINVTAQLNVIININNGKTIEWKNDKRVINK